MEKNYTPLNIEKFNKGSESKINFILFLVLVMTAVVLGMLLYILMQKNTNTKKSKVIITPTSQPTVTPTSIKMITPTMVIPKVSPSAIIDKTGGSPSSTDSPQIITVFPNPTSQKTATGSSTNQ